MVLANLIINLVSALELYLLGRVGLEALAAFSIITSSVYALYLSVHGSLINAAIAMVSRYAGSRQYDAINRAVPQMFYFGLLIYSAYCLVIWLFKAPVLMFFGAKGGVLEMASGYTDILALTFIPMAFYSVFIGIMRGAGDSRTPLNMVLVLAAFTAVLNPLFVIVLKMGLKGVALTALCAFSAASLSYAFVFGRGIHFFRIKAGDFAFEPALFKKYGELTMKSVAQGFTTDAGVIILLKIISGFGNEFLAAYGIVAKLAFFMMMFGWPIGNSGGAVIGHNLGVKMYDRARAAVIEGIKLFSWITVPVAVIFLVFAPVIIPFFSQDAAVIRYGTYYMRLISFFLPALGAALVIQSGFNGAGDIGTATKVSFISYILIRIPVALVLVNFTPLGEYGVFWAIAATVAANAVIFWYLFKKGKWMLKEI